MKNKVNEKDFYIIIMDMQIPYTVVFLITLLVPSSLQSPGKCAPADPFGIDVHFRRDLGSPGLIFWEQEPKGHK